MKRSTVLFSALTGALLISAQAQAATPLADRTGFFFDTVITVSLYDTDDETILDKCFAKMQYYEDTFSRTVEGSDVWKINHSAGEGVQVSEDTIDIINKSLTYAELSDGAFDITIEPVSSLWDFHAEDTPTVPDDADIQAGLPHIDYHSIQIDGNKVTLTDPKAGIDLGAIAKGYISDGIRDVILENGSTSALINLGGNIMAVGEKPDGSAYTIGIRRPFGENAYDIIQKVSVTDGSVITSGTYERYFEQDGKLYHHILDPGTGYPIDNGLTSVSILSHDGADGDALSTTCFVLGAKKGMGLIESLDGIEALFIDADGVQTASTGWSGTPIN